MQVLFEKCTANWIEFVSDFVGSLKKSVKKEYN